MNSWNSSTSYANTVKIGHLDLKREEADAAYNALEDEDVYEMSGWNWILREWTEEQGGGWTIGSNGRSGGYLVLYHSKYEVTEHKSACSTCGQLNFKEVESGTVGKCGRCGALERRNLQNPIRRLSTFPGLDVDQGEDFEEWCAQDVQDRYDLIKSFDETCNQACLAFLGWAMDNHAEEALAATG